jgi:peptide/nickel transport system substrate-binding protein
MRKVLGLLDCLFLLAGYVFAGGEQEMTMSADGSIDRLVIGTDRDYTETYVYHYGSLNMQNSMGFESYFILNEKGEVLPNICTEYEVGDEGKVLRFTIRDDVYWSDGIKMTAEDCAHTYMYGNEHYMGGPTAGLVSAKALSDTLLEIVLDKPNYNWIFKMARTKILPKHVWENVSDPYEFRDFEKTSVTTSPYVLDRIDQDSKTMVFKPHPNHWLIKEPGIKEIVLKYYKNMDTMVLALNKGEIDVLWRYAKGLDYSYVPRLIENDDIKVKIFDANTITNALWFNCKDEWLSDVRLREALSCAIDYEELNTLFTAGYGSMPRSGYVPAVGFDYWKETPLLQQDTEKAISMLNELGFKDLDGDGYREDPKGNRYAPVMILNNTRPDIIRTGERIASYFNEVGIDVEYRFVDKAGFLQTIYSAKTPPEEKDYDFVIYGATYAGLVNGEGYGTFYIGADNFCGWANYDDPDYMEFEEKLVTTLDEAARKEIVHDLMDHISMEKPVITLYQMDIIQPHNSKYSGFEYDPFWGILSQGTVKNLKQIR